LAVALEAGDAGCPAAQIRPMAGNAVGQRIIEARLMVGSALIDSVVGRMVVLV